MFQHMIHPAAARTLFEDATQGGQLFRFAGRHYFDVAVLSVPDPSGKPEFRGFAMHKPTKADALNTPSNEKVANH